MDHFMRFFHLVPLLDDIPLFLGIYLLLTEAIQLNISLHMLFSSTLHLVM